MPSRRLKAAGAARVKMDGDWYYLAMREGKPVFSAGTRPLEEVPSDTWEEHWDDWSRGIGKDYIRGTAGLAVQPHRWRPKPTPVTIGGSGDSLGPIRYWFEAQSATKTYLYGVSPTNIVKIDLTAAVPVKKRSYGPTTASDGGNGGDKFKGQDRLGEPVLANDANGNAKWFIPCNNSSRIMELTTVGEESTGDTLTLHESVVGGAGQFKMLPSGKVIRSLAHLATGQPNGVAQISLLAANADLTVDGNWGGDFPIAEQGKYITALDAYEDFIIVGKQDGWYNATVDADDKISFKSMLPSAAFIQDEPIEDLVTVASLPWHGTMMLCTPHNMHRTDLYTEKPVGINSVQGNADFNFDNQTIRGATTGLTDGGSWLYQGYDAPGFGAFILASREPFPGEDVGHELVHHVIALVATSGKAPERMWITENATAGELLIYNQADKLAFIKLGADRAPDGGGSFGGPSGGGTLTMLPEVIFPSRVLLRETHLTIDAPTVHMLWRPQIWVDGAQGSGTQVVLGSGISSSGSVFFTPGTNDQAHRIMAEIEWATSPGFDPEAIPGPQLVEFTLSGFYLPDVGDTLTFVVDVERTAQMEHKRVSKVLTNLNALRSAGSQAYVDRHGIQGFVSVIATDQASGMRIMGVESGEFVSVNADLVKYS